jgi:hypothetical protein
MVVMDIAHGSRAPEFENRENPALSSGSLEA